MSCGTVWVLQETGHLLILNIKMNEVAGIESVNEVVLKAQWDFPLARWRHIVGFLSFTNIDCYLFK